MREERSVATGLTLIYIECVAGSPAEITKVSFRVSIRLSAMSLTRTLTPTPPESHPSRARVG